MELNEKQNIINKEKSPKKKISPFLQKLYNILEVSYKNNIFYNNIQDENNKNIICWNKEGNGFIIVDYKKFITELLSTNFKTEVFSSFIRQLNLYDFHKIKSKENNNQNNNNNINSVYEFSNVNFLKNEPEKINLIKRKTKNENISNKVIKSHIQGIKGNELVVHSNMNFLNFKNIDKTKLNLNKMHIKILKLSEIVTNLRKRVESLEGKYDFLEYCNHEIGKNNKNIVNKLQKILDKKKTLENLFFYMIRNFFPNIKLIDNSLPDYSALNSSIQLNDQFTDLRNNEIISQIYNVFSLNEKNLANNNINGNNNINLINDNNLVNNNNLFGNINIKNNNNNDNLNNKTSIAKLMDQIVDKDQSNIEAREINTYNKIKDFQTKYFIDLDEQNNSKNNNISFDCEDNEILEP